MGGSFYVLYEIYICKKIISKKGIVWLTDPKELPGKISARLFRTARPGLAVSGKIKQPKSQQYKTVGSLKVITRYVRYARVKETDSGPSCSLAEALEKQDLFINSTLAQLGCNLLWKMFRHSMIEHQGLYLNLATMKVNPIITVR